MLRDAKSHWDDCKESRFVWNCSFFSCFLLFIEIDDRSKEPPEFEKFLEAIATTIEKYSKSSMKPMKVYPESPIRDREDCERKTFTLKLKLEISGRHYAGTYSSFTTSSNEYETCHSKRFFDAFGHSRILSFSNDAELEQDLLMTYLRKEERRRASEHRDFHLFLRLFPFILTQPRIIERITSCIRHDTRPDPRYPTPGNNSWKILYYFRPREAKSTEKLICTQATE